MIFSCTKKVLDKLSKHKTIEKEKAEIGFYNWYVDFINLERKNYCLFTNSKTLFSFFVYAGTQKELKNIEKIFEDKLKEQIIREIGSSDKYLKNLFSDPKEYRFMKTNSRSILGSMTDFKKLIQVHIWHKEEFKDTHGLKHTHDLINHLINEAPMSALKYDKPKDIMKEELESLSKQ